MHEIGVVSGFAAAYRLGAKYPFLDDDNCKRLFALYLGASHGSRMVSFEGSKGVGLLEAISGADGRCDALPLHDSVLRTGRASSLSPSLDIL
jgi:hypothetical protein